MIVASRRSLILTAIMSFALLCLLVGGGIAIRRYIARAFASSEEIHRTQSLAQDALKLQLDEETGIRGIAATHDRLFLQPYFEAHASLRQAFDQLQRDLVDAQAAEAEPALADARNASRTWVSRVALPVIANPGANGELIQVYGKALMDRYRADFARIDSALTASEARNAQAVRDSIDRINAFVGIFVAALLAFGIAYGIQQLRVAERLAEQERIAEQERRERAGLRAAYEAEKRIADTLQEAFTHRPLPLLDSLHLSASYAAATESTLVGGDWYDAMALAENRVLFTIGDVTGHGIEAAVTMNRARQAVISYALMNVDPTHILQRVNTELVGYETRLVTAIVGIADPTTYEFIYAVAGHPPPVLLEPGRPPQFLQCGSVPLGALSSASYQTRRVQTVPGATLVLYTDGAVEHSRNVLEGERLLLEAVTEARDQLNPASSIHRAIFSGRSVADDVAILTLAFAADGALGLASASGKSQIGFGSRSRAVSDIGGGGVSPNINSRITRYTAWGKMAS
ncbi:MAG TPA: SpoIIE family protein phosphatase [Candidatus Acidoferrales bacterium]|nr:SpoIIE family protein phosphatase [Candidatus Acidoferrales bacterium]